MAHLGSEPHVGHQPSTGVDQWQKDKNKTIGSKSGQQGRFYVVGLHVEIHNHRNLPKA